VAAAGHDRLPGPLTHGTALPLLRVQPPPPRMPASAVRWVATSHLVHGVVLELTRRLTVRLLRR
jgi:hypothetical protein